MNTLPDDIILYISKQLNTRDRLSFIQTCKKVYNLKYDVMDIMKFSHIEKHVCTICIKNVCQYTELKYLDLYNSSIKELPQLFTNLKQLQYLNLCNTGVENFTNLPENLVHLNISNNNLSIIPNEILQLTNLSYLDCSSNCLQSIDCLSNTNLTIIEASNNNIETINIIPISCIILDISYNSITRLYVPESIIELNASMNNLQELTGCKKVEILNVICNELSTIPKSNYKKLYLSDNKIENLQYFSNLNTLYIDGNPIKFVQHVDDIFKDDEQQYYNK